MRTIKELKAEETSEIYQDNYRENNSGILNTEIDSKEYWKFCEKVLK